MKYELTIDTDKFTQEQIDVTAEWMGYTEKIYQQQEIVETDENDEEVTRTVSVEIDNPQSKEEFIKDRVLENMLRYMGQALANQVEQQVNETKANSLNQLNALILEGISIEVEE